VTWRDSSGTDTVGLVLVILSKQSLEYAAMQFLKKVWIEFQTKEYIISREK
jgi:hypothetical protein